MNLRNLGKVYESEGMRLWLHPRSPLRVNVVMSSLEKTDLAQDNGTALLREAYLILEGYVLDAEFTQESGLSLYWQNRNLLGTLEERLDLLGTVLDIDAYIVLQTAFKETRGVTALVDTDLTGEKKEVSIAKLPKPSKVESA